MKHLFKDPLIHFLLIGAILFAVSEFSPDPQNGEELVEISRADIEALSANFTRTWQRPPTPKELNGLIEDKVRDEIAYREAVAMGLDEEDLIIRRRLRMKLELLLEDIASLAPPTEQELQNFLDENRTKFRQSPMLSFKQIYLNPDSHGADLQETVTSIAEQLAGAGPELDPAGLGDPTMLPAELPLSSVEVIARNFGRIFADNIVELRPGVWQGPIQSGYGLHFIHVDEARQGRDPELAEVRDEVEREFSARQRREIKDNTYNELRNRYSVRIEPMSAPVEERQ